MTQIELCANINYLNLKNKMSENNKPWSAEGMRNVPTGLSQDEKDILNGRRDRSREQIDAENAKRLRRKKLVRRVGAAVAPLIAVGSLGLSQLKSGEERDVVNRDVPADQFESGNEIENDEFSWQEYDHEGPLLQDVNWANRIADAMGDSFERYDVQRYYEQVFEGSETSPDMAGANIRLFIESSEGDLSNGTSALIEGDDGELSLLTVSHVLDKDVGSVYAYVPGQGTIPLNRPGEHLVTSQIESNVNNDPAMVVELTGELNDFFNNLVDQGEIRSYQLAEEMPEAGESVFYNNPFSATRSEFKYIGPASATDYLDAAGDSPVFVGIDDITLDELGDGKFDRSDLSKVIDEIDDMSYSSRSAFVGPIAICEGYSGGIFFDESLRVVATVASHPGGRDQTGWRDFALDGVGHCNVVVAGSPVR